MMTALPRYYPLHKKSKHHFDYFVPTTQIECFKPIDIVDATIVFAVMEDVWDDVVRWWAIIGEEACRLIVDIGGN